MSFFYKLPILYYGTVIAHMQLALAGRYVQVTILVPITPRTDLRPPRYIVTARPTGQTPHLPKKLAQGFS